MIDVAIASCLTLPEPDPDEEILLAALRARGVRAEVWGWDDPARDWSSARRVVVRSTWNYVHHAPAFLAWCEQVAPRLDNPIEVVRWNWHKRYLLELAARGIPVAPTRLVARREPRALDVVADGWDVVVVKPAVSAGSFATVRARRGEPAWAAADAHLARHAAERDMLVQAYLPSVEGYGERALVCIAGQLSHAVRKSPRFLGDDESVSEALPIAPAEAALAARVLAAAPRQDLLYARVDVAPGADAAPVLMELELIEPSLFLLQAPAALEKLVAAVCAKIA